MDKIKKYSSKNHLVTRSNALIESTQTRFSAMQQRVLHTALSQIRKGDKLTTQVLYEIPIKAIADLAGREASGEFYKATLRAAESLRTASMVIQKAPDGSDLKNKDSIILSPIQTVRFNDESGQLAVRFNEDAIPYFSDLAGKGFTQYSINGGLLHMDSAYAYRLHDLIARWGDLGTKEVSVDSFRWMMGIDDDKYPRFSNLRARVIEPAIKEINEHSQYVVKVGYRREKRRVVALQLAFTVKSDTAKKKGSDIRYITRSDVEKEGLARSGESWDQCIARLKKSKIIVK